MYTSPINEASVPVAKIYQSVGSSDLVSNSFQQFYVMVLYSIVKDEH